MGRLNSTGAIAKDTYLWNDCRLFLERKEAVTLDLCMINRNFEYLHELVFYNVIKNENDECVKEMDNVMRPEWLSMFPNIRQVTIRDDVELTPSYKFRLEDLLKTVQQISKDITVIVWVCGRDWYEKALTDDMSKLYDTAGWSIEYNQNGYDTFGGPKYELVIKAKQD